MKRWMDVRREGGRGGGEDRGREGDDRCMERT